MKCVNNYKNCLSATKLSVSYASISAKTSKTVEISVELLNSQLRKLMGHYHLVLYCILMGVKMMAHQMKSRSACGHV